MNESGLEASFGLHLVKDFFDAETCAKIVVEMGHSQGGAASVYGTGESGSVDLRVRRTTRVKPTAATVEFVRRRLLEYKPEVEKHFRLSLDGCEEPQFLRYAEGDFFVAHQDGNTGMLKLDSDRDRRVSVVIFLNRQSDEAQPGSYRGGSLVFSSYRDGRDERLSLSGEAGMLVAFRAETTHEVTTVAGGERFTIACWYRCDFDRFA